jgi:hypothetical protein
VLEDPTGIAGKAIGRTGAGASGPSRTVGRRAVLAASAAMLPVALAACRGVQVLGSPPPPAPDITALRTAIATEQLLVAMYGAAAGRPGQPHQLVVALTTVGAEHAQHLTELRSRLIEPASASPSPSTSPVVSLPAGQSAMVAALSGAEQSAAGRLLADLAGLPPSAAQLFASIAASEATHVPYLKAAGSHG